MRQNPGAAETAAMLAQFPQLARLIETIVAQSAQQAGQDTPSAMPPEQPPEMLPPPGGPMADGIHMESPPGAP